MKQSVTLYIVIDPTTNLFWRRRSLYTHAPDGSPVYYTEFTDSLSVASTMTKSDAEGVLDRFKRNKHIQGGKYKADLQFLTVSPITITHEL